MALAIPAVLIGVLAFTTARSQHRAHEGVHDEFARRAALAASLTASTLTSSTAEWSRTFGGPRAGLTQALRASGAYEGAASAVLDARGARIASWPVRGWKPDPVAADAIGRALAGAVAVSDLAAGGGVPGGVVTLALPVRSSEGRRVLVETLPARVVASFASAYLATAPAIRGGEGFLVDGNGRVLAASTRTPPGGLLPDGAVAAALRYRSSGVAGDRHYTAAELPGTRWRVVLTAPTSLLMQSVDGSGRSAWLLFGAFSVALLLLVAMGLLALRRSSELAGARGREHAARKLAHERLHDALTGLPNRALFLDRAAQALAVSQRTRRAVAVLFLDLDRFKRINDSLGHASGDALLTTVAGRLDATLRPGDTISRFGGDEFLILCDDLDGVDDAIAIAERVTAALDQPFDLDARDVHVSCCIGIALHHPDAPVADPAVLVRDADAAMYSAKAQGAGSVRVFDADLRGEALMRLDTEVALRGAIGAGELRVHYQPIVALADGTLCGVEALVRWERPGVGLVPPLAFIGVAEECGLIAELGSWVLRTAMADVARWHRAGLLEPDFALSVNVSALQLADGALPAVIAEGLQTWSLDPSALWLEITETAVASDPEAARDRILALSALGVRVAIDDFGVGQSSLEQLAQQLPVDVLKLDRSFTSHLDDERQRAVIAAIAPMAEALHMTAVAEGVETAGQAEQLGALGYELAQGYHFGRPVSADAMHLRLAGRNIVAR
ncbi:MAG TPA: EAL domain-containing protein [Solirubrobacteraceae bacterium]|nr:EAL domain-containing protein [Solirubrobacteraceae bacterium]